MNMKMQMWNRILGMLIGASLSTEGFSQQVGDIEVPGDHFSLEGALELFKKSSSPEEFERLLNVPDSKVNNLDLNGDRQTDYIKVIDRYDGHVHAFILQAVISERELQDIAVIELEQNSDGTATLQIVGDADIYGVETIIEPTEQVRVYAGASTRRNVVNVWNWPVVQYVYSPYYNVWISPWNWYSRPVWYYPWRPVSYVVYRPYWDPYRPYYTHCYYHRNLYAQRIYVPVRTTSVTVYNSHHNIVRSRNTRGRDYDRDGYYRGEQRNGSRPQDVRVRSYDNSRDQSVGRGRENNSRDRSSYSGRESSSGNANTEHRSGGRSTYEHSSHDRNTSDFTSTPRSESRESTVSRPRDTQQTGGSRSHTNVTRGSSNEHHTPNVSSHPRSSESQSRSHSGNVSTAPRQSHSTPHVQSGGSQHSSQSHSTGASHGAGPAKRGRD